ncbi:MAG: hypothetical protein ACI9TA_003261 [Reinekea sp.]|jgi:hypothetical protein
MRLLIICALLAAPMITRAETTVEDGPWIAIPTDAAFLPTTMTLGDVIALADLDGDPLTISADEKEMIAVLIQIFGTQPVQN